MKAELLKVAGMACGRYTNNVTNALEEVSGVSDVKISLKAGEAIVHYDERLASPEQLKVAVTNAGYSVGADDFAGKIKGKGCCCN